MACPRRCCGARDVYSPRMDRQHSPLLLAVTMTEEGSFELRTAEPNAAAPDSSTLLRFYAPDPVAPSGGPEPHTHMMQLQSEEYTKATTEEVTDSFYAGAGQTRLLQFDSFPLHGPAGRVVAPTWHEKDACEVCQKGFGLCHFRPRHHCRACGASACGRCSVGRIPLPAVTGHSHPVRVCNPCWMQATRSWLQTSKRLRSKGDPPEAAVCVVCMEEFATAVFIPCGHLCLCSTCATKRDRSILHRACPLCRQKPKGIYTVYF